MNALVQTFYHSSRLYRGFTISFLVTSLLLTGLAPGQDANVYGSQMGTGSFANAGRTPRPGFQFIEKNSELQYRVVMPSEFGAGTTMHGYCLIKVEVFNNDEAKHTVKLLAESSSYNPGAFGKYCQNTSSGDVSLEAGAIASLKTYTPNLTFEIERLSLFVDGYRKELNRLPNVDHLTGSLFSRGRMNKSSASMLFAMPPATEYQISNDITNIKSIESVDGFSGNGYWSVAGLELNNVELMWAPEASNWDDDWLSYTSYTNLGMSKTFFEQLPQSKREAIRQYITIGGTITFLESDELPKEFKNEKLGKKIRRKLTIRAARLDSDISYFSYGLGVINITPTAITEWKLQDLRNRRVKNDQVNWESLVQGFKRPSFYDDIYSSSAQTNLAMVDEKRVDLNIVFWAVLAFILLVGPINYFIARLYFKNMMAILVTTPVFSIVITVLFVIADYFSQGLTPTSITECFTILDEKNRQAYSIGTTGYYSPIQPGQLTFDTNTELLPTTNFRMEDDQFGYSRGRTNVTATADISFAQNQQILLSGWVKPRESVYFHFRQSTRSDLRVAFEATEEGGVRATNGLGVDIKSLYYRDQNAKVFVAKEILAGESSIMEFEGDGRIWQTGNTIPEEINSLVPLRSRSIFRNMMDKRLMRNGHYIAETVESAFVQPGQSGTIVKPKSSFIYGIQGESK